MRIAWQQEGEQFSASWWSANDVGAPKRVVPVDDRLTADEAVKYASQGIAMLWLGDFNNARQLLSAIDRRVTRAGEAGKRKKRAGGVRSGSAAEIAAQSDAKATSAVVSTGTVATTEATLVAAHSFDELSADDFYRIRQARAGRSRMLSLLLVPLELDEATGEMGLPLPRAPRVGPAIAFAYGPQLAAGEPHAVVSLQELIGVRSAFQWFENGVEVPRLEAKIYPHYGTFLPTRQEYVDLVAEAPIAPGVGLAFDIGTGTGVLAAVLAQRSVHRVIATDIHQRAVDCANDNFTRLGVAGIAQAQLISMFPEGCAQLIVCNPPWLPGNAATTLDAAVYDPGSKMLLQFLNGLPQHLTADGEGWLILSDLAELLGLRSREMLLEAIAQAGLEVVDRLDTVPRHGRANDSSDPLHAARSREVTSLWRLRVNSSASSSQHSARSTSESVVGTNVVSASV